MLVRWVCDWFVLPKTGVAAGGGRAELWSRSSARTNRESIRRPYRPGEESIILCPTRQPVCLVPLVFQSIEQILRHTQKQYHGLVSERGHCRVDAPSDLIDPSHPEDQSVLIQKAANSRLRRACRARHQACVALPREYRLDSYHS